MRFKWILFAVVVAAVGGGYYYTHSGSEKHAQAGGRESRRAMSGVSDEPVPVVVGTVAQGDVPIYLSGLGTVQAFNTVAIKSRVDGQLIKLLFKEGQDVRAGDSLAIIDPRPYEAQYKQALAAKAKDEALLANARKDLVRDQGLVGKQFVSTQTLDTQQALVDQYTAQIASDQATIDYNKTQVDYTNITSPIDGRTGIRNVDAGNIVHAGDTVSLVTITQIHPITVIFTLPADNLPSVTKGLGAGGLPVIAYGRDNTSALAKGMLDLVDNQIDQTTGMVKLKATFPNEDGALWPGQFVNTSVLVSTRKAGLTVAATVVQHGPKGDYVWVVKPDKTVEMRDVTVAQTQGNQALIDKGLTVGEQVVVDGQYRLQTGSKIEVATPDAPAPATADEEKAPHRGHRGEKGARGEKGEKADKSGADPA
ncbi:MAG TPA: efflux RND transporter periplasmic adaptor subunit [Aliidongia sp.]|uniref:efflux RND transporter periplasmic adaptor subunit n=1 Tax=Aliidongia sp. TaxID=1914230 RepID=UPI002DDD6874|nr:efflux RND transporter periplasmic adaptor subunit [Aliidongia sp.]HEV2676271.1 efflux RND transporter periplasmic adaptor subunit [Aliidongia sp.]